MLDRLIRQLREADIDLVDKGDEYEVSADVPGFDKEEITLRVRDNVLFITARHEEYEGEQEESYLRSEREQRALVESVRFPEEIDVDWVTANYRNGVLTVTLPKSETPEMESREIEIE
jgi:HSP20 family protein